VDQALPGRRQIARTTVPIRTTGRRPGDTVGDVPRPAELGDTAAPSGAVPARVVVDVDEAHGASLFGFAYRLGLTSEEADDAVQEVLLRLFRTLSSGVVVDDPKGWSFRTRYRIAMDQHRLRRRVSGLRERLGWVEGQRAHPDDDRRISLWSEVDRLPMRQRQVLYLRFKADLTFDEVASTMGITAGGARAVANKALTSLRTRMRAEDQP